MLGKVFTLFTSLILFIGLMIPQPVLGFNKTSIISQDETTYNGVTASEVQAYLNTTGSQLAGYRIPEEYEVYYPIGKGQWDKVVVRQEWQSNLRMEKYYGKTVAELIAEWSALDESKRAPANPGKMNPLIALATLDKESGAITGSYKSSILDRPVTMSWLMGYAFDGRMADCINLGNCDYTGNGITDDEDKAKMRERAIWYGGPGIQIAEGISALKRWSATPTQLNTCNEGGWQRMLIGGECLTLQNSITYALYRYTPNFSGNTLFLSLYDKIKKAFPFPSSTPPPDETANDTTEYSHDTYAKSFSLIGYKASNTQAYFNGRLIADFGKTSWELSFEPPSGKNTYSVDYRRSDGSTINRKYVQINRRKVGDINNDGKVDIQDLSILATYWGHTDPPNPMTNLNADVDNEVNILDLSQLAANFEG